MARLWITFFSLYLLANGQAQVHERGKGYLRLSQYYINANSFLDSDSKPQPIRTNSYYFTNLCFEYGVTSRLTVRVLFPAFVRTTVNSLQYNQSGNTSSGASLNSIGDTEIGVKYAIRNKMPLQIIGYAVLGVPLGRKGNIGTETDLHTGDGEFNQMAGMQLRQTVSAVTLMGYVAFNNRSKNYSNEIRYGLEATYRSKRFDGLVRISAIESLFNDTAPVALNGLFSNHREIFSPGVELRYKLFNKISLVASTDFIAGGRNTLKAPLFGFGVQFTKQ